MWSSGAASRLSVSALERLGTLFAKKPAKEEEGKVKEGKEGAKKKGPLETARSQNLAIALRSFRDIQPRDIAAAVYGSGGC